jgi:hypothetical protein
MKLLPESGSTGTLSATKVSSTGGPGDVHARPHRCSASDRRSHVKEPFLMHPYSEYRPG